jgi:hypothetical protein
MFHDPIKQRLFEANVFAGFFALDPLVLQDLGALGKELLVENRILNELRLTFFQRRHLSLYFHKIWDQSTLMPSGQQDRITGIRRESPAIYLVSFEHKAADASLRQNFTKTFGDLFELAGNGRLPVLAHDRHAAIACFARRDIDRDLAKQRDA